VAGADDRLDDRTLLLAWRRGDARAGSELVARHAPALYRFYRAKVPAAELTDLSQRVLLACVEGVARIPDGVDFKAYLLGIARNKLLHHLRKHGREKRALEGIAEAAAEPEGSPSRMLAAQEELQLLARAVLALPLDLQMTIELFYWEELSITDIGHVLEVSPGTVKSRLFRARSLLREHVERLAASPELSRATREALDRWTRALEERAGQGG
jgi:RNA polymerase sigma-70 factor (ECF subfamily)